MFMFMLGDYEAQYSLAYTNMRAPRLIWPFVPLLICVGTGRWMGKVGGCPTVEQPETHLSL